MQYPGSTCCNSSRSLDSTRVQARLLQKQRAQFEHAIAALTGVPAPQFSIEPKLITSTVPAIPLGVPSDVLQRRPDIASAERAMAAANAQIGVAKAAFFPSVTLNGNIGWESTQFANLLSAPSLLWMLGTTVGQVVFDGGRRAANVDFANEGYKAAEANYRQTVLNAFEQVQDGIVGLSVLDDAAKESHAAVNRFAAPAVARERSLLGRTRRVSRRHYRTAIAAAKRTPGRTDSRAAVESFGGARQSVGRWLGCGVD